MAKEKAQDGKHILQRIVLYYSFLHFFFVIIHFVTTWTIFTSHHDLSPVHTVVAEATVPT